MIKMRTYKIKKNIRVNIGASKWRIYAGIIKYPIKINEKIISLNSTCKKVCGNKPFSGVKKYSNILAIRKSRRRTNE